jgi:Ner family transcriptional regulator
MNNDATPERVKEMILATGITLTALSVKHGFCDAAVSIALRKRSPYVQKVIAEHLGVRPQELWPSRYDENGSPVRLDPRGRSGNRHTNGYSGQPKGKAA